MKIEPLVKRDSGTCNSPARASGNIGPVPEFEHLREWARLAVNDWIDLQGMSAVS